MSIGSAVVFYTRTAYAFSAGVYCRHCRMVCCIWRGSMNGCCSTTHPSRWILAPDIPKKVHRWINAEKWHQKSSTRNTWTCHLHVEFIPGILQNLGLMANLLPAWILVTPWIISSAALFCVNGNLLDIVQHMDTYTRIHLNRKNSLLINVWFLTTTPSNVCFF